MYLAKIYVTLKPAVNDPQGQTVLGSLAQLGFVSVDDVRMGKYLEVTINENDQARAREVRGHRGHELTWATATDQQTGAAAPAPGRGIDLFWHGPAIGDGGEKACAQISTSV